MPSLQQCAGTRAPRFGLHADRLRARDVVDVQHARMVEHRQVNRFAGALHQRAQIWPRFGDDVHLAPHPHAELEQREAEPIGAGLADSSRGIRRRPASTPAGARCSCQRQPAREVADADLVLVVGERLDEPHRIGDRRQPRLRPLAGRRLRRPFHAIPRSDIRNTSLAPDPARPLDAARGIVQQLPRGRRSRSRFAAASPASHPVPDRVRRSPGTDLHRAPTRNFCGRTERLRIISPIRAA